MAKSKCIYLGGCGHSLTEDQCKTCVDFTPKEIRLYYTLLEKENGWWSVQFGDYDHEVVKQELQDMVGTYSQSKEADIKKKDLKIVVHYDNQNVTTGKDGSINILTIK